MPIVAETQLADGAAWFAASSKPTASPLGDPIIRGLYATLVPVGMDDAGADLEALVAQGTLPIFTPQAVGTGIDLTPPQNRAALTDRALHLIWKAQQAK